MAAEGTAARGAAAELLGAVLSEGRTVTESADDAMGPLSRLPPPERARAQRLALTTLRHLEQIDAVLDPLLRRAPPRFARNVLRVAVAELSEGAAAHGAVNAAVELVRRGPRTGHLAGLMNAVLRQVAALPAPLAGHPPQRLPRWLRQPLVHAWGREAVSAMESVQSRPPPLDLTLKAGAAVDIPGATLLPTGSLRLAQPGQVSLLSGHDQGAWWVQDAAAAIPARLLDAQPGERVADLCAAPGGKTLQLAATGADVTAVDMSGPRLARLHENLARCGLTARVVTADVLHWQPEAPFDAVLLDAPCSATGTIRRHPDLPFVKDGSDLPVLVALQSALIDRALAMLRPGGRLVFATCSLLPEEGEGQLAATLARHPGLTVEPPALPGLDPAWITPQGALRIRPDHWADRGGIDGFFIARLRLPG